MAKWQSRLEKLVRISGQLPEPLIDIFSASKPLKSPWPAELPSNPTLQEFYRICNGGRFGGNVYDWLPRKDIAGDTASLKEWLKDIGGGSEAPEEFLVLAHDDYGDLVWDILGDQTSAYCSNGDCWEHYGQSLDQFFENLFSAECAQGELAKEWADVLRCCS